MKRDIQTRDDIYLIIETFYRNLMGDPGVKHFFTEVRSLNLEEHIPVIVDFWENIIFQTGSYKDNAMAKHYALHDASPIQNRHFEIWLQLFNESVDHFSGINADLAKERASQIAQLMAYKIKTEKK